MPALVFYPSNLYSVCISDEVFHARTNIVGRLCQCSKGPISISFAMISQCEALFFHSLFHGSSFPLFRFLFFFCKSTPWGETVGHAYLNLWTMLTSRYSRWHFARLCSNDVEEWEKDKMSTLWTLRITSGLWQVLQLTLIYSYLSTLSFFLIVTS